MNIISEVVYMQGGDEAKRGIGLGEQHQLQHLIDNSWHNSQKAVWFLTVFS
jgi:hypothetical protein